MLITKNGLERPVEVIDPEAAQLVAKGEWREATEDEQREYSEYLLANPAATSHAAKLEAVRAAGLDAPTAQPSQVVHTTPQVTGYGENEALKLRNATGISHAPLDGEFSESDDYAATSAVTVEEEAAERAERDIEAHNATTPQSSTAPRRGRKPAAAAETTTDEGGEG